MGLACHLSVSASRFCNFTEGVSRRPMQQPCRRRALARQAMRSMRFMRPRLAPFAALLLFASTLSIASAQTPNEPPHSLELSRPVRPWEFLPVVGTRAALFGNEAGRMEAWVYPLKISARIPSAISRRRSRHSSGIAGAHGHCSAGIEHHRLQQRHLHRARNLSCPGERARRDHPARCGNRAAARNRSELRARFSIGVARRNRRHVHVVGCERPRVCHG